MKTFLKKDLRVRPVFKRRRNKRSFKGIKKWIFALKKKNLILVFFYRNKKSKIKTNNCVKKEDFKAWNNKIYTEGSIRDFMWSKRELLLMLWVKIRTKWEVKVWKVRIKSVKIKILECFLNKKEIETNNFFQFFPSFFTSCWS